MITDNFCNAHIIWVNFWNNTINFCPGNNETSSLWQSGHGNVKWWITQPLSDYAFKRQIEERGSCAKTSSPPPLPLVDIATNGLAVWARDSESGTARQLLSIPKLFLSLSLSPLTVRVWESRTKEQASGWMLCVHTHRVEIIIGIRKKERTCKSRAVSFRPANFTLFALAFSYIASELHFHGKGMEKKSEAS